MKNFFRKCVIVIVAFLSLGSSLIAMAAFADLTTEIWIAFLVVAISAAILCKTLIHISSNLIQFFGISFTSLAMFWLMEHKNQLQNYKQIQTSINTNVLHLKKDFQAELLKILDD